MNETSKPFSYFDILEACQAPGCPLCRLAERSVNRFLDGLMYEHVNDPGVRMELRQSLGFCQTHVRWLLNNTSGVALGVALIYRDVVNLVGETIKKAEEERRALFAPSRFLDWVKGEPALPFPIAQLQPTLPCPACTHRDEMVVIILHAMLDALPDDPPMRRALQESEGLCLPHFQQALGLTRDEATISWMMALTMERLTHLRADLDEYIRKNDYRFIKDGFGKEGDSWQRALHWVVGGGA